MFKAARVRAALQSRLRLRNAVAAVFLALASAASAVAGDFHAANQLYDQGKFSEAKQQYEQLAEAGEWSANLFYNLGNANYRLGAPGPAMLAYERALALDPSHPEARANLELLRRQSSARLWPSSWRDAAFPTRRVDACIIGAAVAAWVFVFLAVAIFSAPCARKTGLWFGALAAAAAAAYCGGAIWHFAENRALAVIVANSAEARLAPAQSAASAGTWPAGSQVRILSERGDWVYCALPGANRGWIPAPALSRVSPRGT